MYKVDKNIPIHWHGNCLEIRLLPLDDKVHYYGNDVIKELLSND